MPHCSLVSVAALLAVCASVGHAVVQMPAIFSDGMVLQTSSAYGARSFVFGVADPSEVVSANMTFATGVTLSYQVTADNSTGRWRIELNPAASQTGITLRVWGSSDPANITTINDVAFGDVYLCGGQSNMVMSVGAAFDGNATSSVTYPYIRLFSVIETGADTPQPLLPPFVNRSVSRCAWGEQPPTGNPDKHVCQTWQVAEPGVTEYMSAICFYTALSLIQSGAIPANRTVGLLHSAYSGTAMELWVPQPVIDACNVTAGYGDSYSSSGDEEAKTAAALAAAHQRPATAGAGAGAGAAPLGNSVLYNAMIYPIAGYSIRALLWNEGESCMGDTFEYFSCLFQGLLAQWRRDWGMGDFAVVYVQLGGQECNSSDWPAYIPTPRDAQSSALPGRSHTYLTGMVAAYDKADRSSPYAPCHVHARNKTEIGRRAALQVQHVQFGEQWYSGAWTPPSGTLSVDHSGPWPTALWLNETDSTLILNFTTLTGRGIYMAPTADCWECCAANDTFQVTDQRKIYWWNASADLIPGAAGSPPTAVRITPLQPAGRFGPWAAIRYAPSLWVQCAVYSVSNQVPVNTFSTFNVTANVTSLWSAPSSASSSSSSLSVGKRAYPPVAMTPPMGMNTWNFMHSNVDEGLIRATAQTMVSVGLLAAGYEYVNIDDTAFVDRDAVTGQLIPDPVRFPSGMKALADYVHSLGMKLGVYTAQGSKTCQDRPGSYQHELLDAATLCAWGIDYLKIDLCGGTMYPQRNTSWTLFKQGFEQCVAGGGRPIVESIEYCNDPSCGSTIANVANVWRTTGDIQANWASVLTNLDGNNAMAPFTKPGGWADADMLQVGNPGLSLTESKAHFTAWCIIASPLLIGTDLTQPDRVDPQVLAILTAPEVLAVNQDALGKQGVRVSAANASGVECWAKPLADGTVAAMLLNRGEPTATATCTWAQLSLAQPNGAAAVRDLWERQDLGSFTGSYSAVLEAHSAVLIKVTQG